MCTEHNQIFFIFTFYKVLQRFKFKNKYSKSKLGFAMYQVKVNFAKNINYIFYFKMLQFKINFLAKS